jgi:hypothetical protein
MKDDVSSKLHHYIPQFYLRGFSDEDEMLFVYDKKAQRIYRSSLENSFAETHRNTGTLTHPETGETYRSDLVERMISRFDEDAAAALQVLRNSKSGDQVLDDPTLLEEIKLLISSIFWRSPVNDQLRIGVIETHSFEDLGFGIFDKNGERNPEMEELMKSIDLWNKMYPALLPISGLVSKFRKKNDDNWLLYHRPVKFHIVTDNPVILKEYKDLSSLQEELIFPLSANILILNTKKYKPGKLPGAFSLKVDLLLFNVAGRFVASSNKDYLKFLANEVNTQLSKSGWADKLKEDIFNYFY